MAFVVMQGWQSQIRELKDEIVTHKEDSINRSNEMLDVIKVFVYFLTSANLEQFY
jgi:hypothetical protein